MQTTMKIQLPISTGRTMKHLFAGILSLAVIAFFSCTSSTKLLQKGYYDSAIARSVQELKEKPDNKKEITVLAKAYKLANELDNERIKFLKQSKEPQVWEEIYAGYSRLKSRQDMVKPLDESILQAINFTPVDYDQDIIDSKRKAADFLFGRGKTLLAKNDRLDAREAYACFSKVKEYLPAFTGIDDKINEAYARGITYAYFKIQNTSTKALPRLFEEDLLKISMEGIHNDWVNFNTRYDNRIKYDYTIILNIRKIEVTPELMASSDFVESKEVEDGWEYVLDAKGNVTKDSAGNDCKRTKHKTIKGYVTKFSLGKNATVSGTLDFFDNSSGQVVKTDPVSADSKFEFIYASVKGDQDALTPETRKMIGLKITPFPNNEEMIFRTSEALKQLAKNIISANQQLLQ